MKDKTILLTGSSGFIGFHTAKVLLDRGYRVVGIDSHNDSTSVPLKEHRQSVLDREEAFTFVLGSICNQDLLRSLFQEYDFFCVVNLAARAGVRKSLQDPESYIKDNEIGLINLLSLCREKGISRFLQASTSSVYEGESMPFLETACANRPISPYASSKKAAETYVHVYHHLSGMHATILRFFTVYGPYGRPDMSVLRFCKDIYENRPLRINGDGTQTRDFTYVEDVARAVVLCVEKMEGFQIYNVGNDHTHSLLDMIGQLEKSLKKQATLNFLPRDSMDMAGTRANIDKLRSLGWTPQISLSEGIPRVASWFTKEYDWIRHLDFDS